jgi:hypothetical protein
VSAWRPAGILVVVGMLGLGAAQAVEQDRRGLSAITDARVDEASGMVMSTKRPGLAYVINDSGNDPVVYVVDVSSGAVVGTSTLSGVELLDSEALTLTDEGLLLIADIGDNGRDRDEVALLTIEQPEPGDSSVEPTVYPVRYADGPADAEGVLVEPGTGRILIATKGIFGGGQLLALPASWPDGEVSVARPLDVETPALVTDAATLSDGSAAVLRTYGSMYVYSLPSWELVYEDGLPRTKQGETLAVDSSGKSAFIGSEGSPSPIIRVPLPDVTKLALDQSSEPSDPKAEPTPEAVDTSSSDGGGGLLTSLRAVAVAGGAALLLAAALLLRRRR